MLQSIHNMAQSWIVKSLMLMLAVSFSIWGIGDIFRGNAQQKAVAKVGSATVTVQQLEQAFKQELPEARRVLGPQLTESEARQVGVLDRTLNALMQKAAIELEIKRLGFNIANKDLMKTFANYAEFQDKEGRFDLGKWRAALRRVGKAEQYVLDAERDHQSRKLLLSGLVEGIQAPKTVLDDLYRARGDKRILQVLSLRNDSQKDVKTPDDKAMHAFYDKEGAQLFTAPEYRSITLAILNVDAVTKNITFSDDDLKKAYESRKDELKRPERRDLLQVVVQDEAKARALADAVKDGDDLAKVAKTKGMTAVPIKGVDDKSVMHELFTSVFGLEEGQISPPIKSTLGWHVVQLTKIHAGGVPPLDEVKDELRDTLRNERASDTISRVVNQLDDELAAGHALEDIADTLKLRLIKVPALDSKGQEANGTTPKELPAAADVIKTAYGQASGETSAVIDDGKGNYLVVRTDDVAPSKVRPYDEVKGQVQKLLLAQDQAEAAKKHAETMAQAWKDGKSVTAMAAQAGVDVRTSKPISMLGDKDAELPVSLMVKALQMKKGDILLDADKEKQYVFKLAEIVPVDPAKKDSAGMQKIADDLDQRLPLDYLEQYVNHLKETFPVRIDQPLLDDLKHREVN